MTSPSTPEIAHGDMSNGDHPVDDAAESMPCTSTFHGPPPSGGHLYKGDATLLRGGRPPVLAAPPAQPSSRAEERAGRGRSMHLT